MNLEFFSAISLWLSFIFVGAILALFFVFGILIFNAQGVGLSVKPAIKYIVFLAVLLVAVSFSLYKYMEELPLSKAEELLSKPGEVAVYVDGEKKAIVDQVLTAFRERRYIKISGSRPFRYIRLTIESKGHSLEFRLGQDSSNPNLFWLYYPDYRWHASLCYLEIHSKLLL